MIAVLIPINSPFVFTNAPPELPGFTAASVWINASIAYLSSSRILILRAFAETIPAVTVDSKLKGLPIAKTHSPTRILSELPKRTADKPAASIFNTATSV